VIAYYLIHGVRDPEQMIKIASAPGFANMSQKDWEVYNRAWAIWLRDLAEERYKNDESELPDDYSDLRRYFVQELGKRLDEYAAEGNFPILENLVGQSFEELIRQFGPLIYYAYKEALVQVHRLAIDNINLMEPLESQKV
jgi:hypothetical protein